MGSHVAAGRALLAQARNMSRQGGTVPDGGYHGPPRILGLAPAFVGSPFRLALGEERWGGFAAGGLAWTWLPYAR